MEKIIICAIRISESNVIDGESLNKAFSIITESVNVYNRVQEMTDVVNFAIQYCNVNSIRKELINYAKSLEIIKNESDSNNKKVDVKKILELTPKSFSTSVLSVN